MAICYTDTTRNNRLTQVSNAIDAGATGGNIRIYNGTRPACGGTPTTLLSELTFSTTSFGAPAAGVITANAITDDASADSTGTATWFRIVDSNATFVSDGSVGVTGSGADLELNSVAIGVGQVVSISSFAITEGNG